MTGPPAVSSRQPHWQSIVFGAVAGAATWLLIDLIGVPEIFGIGSDAGLIPLTVLGAIFGLTKLRFILPTITLLLLSLVIVVSYTSVIVKPAQSLIRSDPVPKGADAVVALSAGVTSDGLMTQQSTDRTLKAVELVEDGVAPVLVFTRELKKAKGKEFSSADDQRRIAWLAHLQKLYSTRPVKSTHDEALAVRSISIYRNWKHIILVTSPFHSRRACAAFENVGLFVSCIPSDSRDVAVKRLAHPHDRLAAFGFWLYETVGTLRYRVAGWI